MAFLSKLETWESCELDERRKIKVMSKMSICMKIQNRLFFYLTSEITLTQSAIPMVPFVFSALGHIIKCVTIKIKRNLTA